MTGSQFREQVGSLINKPSHDVTNLDPDANDAEEQSNFIEELENMDKFKEIK